MGAGFGALPAGTGSFGTQEVSDLLLSESVSVSESLTASVPFRVESATSLSKTLVKLDFSGFVDPDHPSNFDLANYTIAGLVVLNVDPLASSKSVLIQTSTQLHTTYTIDVNSTPGVVQGVGGDELDPLFDSTTFLGDATPATFTAVAQSRRKIRLTFSQPMLADSEFSSPANFLLSALTGDGVNLLSIEQISSTKAQIMLAEDLVPFAIYVLQITSAIHTVTGDSVYPDTATVQWQEVVPKPIRLEVSRFSGEVSGGLLGHPDGQIFFSPAFGLSAPNSVIQVDSASVCTQASDVYRIPSLPDPLVLYTFPAPIGTNAALGAAGGVLRASAARLGLATMVVSDVREDAFPAATDGPATGTLEEPIDITRASFLNDARWRISPGVGASLGAFRTADNQTPIGPGATVGPFAIL